MSEYSPDRVQGMLGAAERWQKVSPKAVVSGSTAQAENVLTDAIHDIACLWRVANEAATEIASLRRELEEARAALRKCGRVFDLLIEPEKIVGSTVMAAFAMVTETRAAIRNLAGEKADG